MKNLKCAQIADDAFLSNYITGDWKYYVSCYNFMWVYPSLSDVAGFRECHVSIAVNRFGERYLPSVHSY